MLLHKTFVLHHQLQYHDVRTASKQCAHDSQQNFHRWVETSIKIQLTQQQQRQKLNTTTNIRKFLLLGIPPLLSISLRINYLFWNYLEIFILPFWFPSRCNILSTNELSNDHGMFALKVDWVWNSTYSTLPNLWCARAASNIQKIYLH